LPHYDAFFVAELVQSVEKSVLVSIYKFIIPGTMAKGKLDTWFVYNFR